MNFWMDDIGEISEGVMGYMKANNEVDVVAVTSTEPRKGNVSRFLDSLPRNKTVTFHDVTSDILQAALEKRGFVAECSYSKVP